ncbi:MAG: Spy/CpxP family protein refolding chaperone [Leptolyngbyaceae cyanobacterium bins.302]|nr:Spy/CpxP family protein refolding chaperone [Leptolyngbyaceae cyanobacterium bins.302]
MFVRSLAAIAALFFTGGSVLVLTDAIAVANPNQPSPRLAQRRPHSARTDWLRDLNLSPEQVQKIQEIRNQHQERLAEQKQAVRQAQQELKQLMASKASTEQIRQKFDQLQDLKQKLGNTRMEVMLAIRNVLNPEQRQKLNEVVKQQGRGGRDRDD